MDLRVAHVLRMGLLGIYAVLVVLLLVHVCHACVVLLRVCMCRCTHRRASCVLYSQCIVFCTEYVVYASSCVACVLYRSSPLCLVCVCYERSYVPSLVLHLARCVLLCAALLGVCCVRALCALI